MTEDPLEQLRRARNDLSAYEREYGVTEQSSDRATQLLIEQCIAEGKDPADYDLVTPKRRKRFGLF